MDAHHVHDAGEVVGQHVQRHLGGNPWQRLHQEVCGSHPGFDRAEGSFVVRADGDERFAEAVRKKLLLEIAGPARRALARATPGAGR